MIASSTIKDAKRNDATEADNVAAKTTQRDLVGLNYKMVKNILVHLTLHLVIIVELRQNR
jgi:hypothetical protein